MDKIVETTFAIEIANGSRWIEIARASGNEGYQTLRMISMNLTCRFRFIEIIETLEG